MKHTVLIVSNTGCVCQLIVFERKNISSSEAYHNWSGMNVFDHPIDKSNMAIRL